MKFYRVVLFLLISAVYSVSPSFAYFEELEVENTFPELEKWVSSSLMCRNYSHIIDESNKKFNQRVKELGFKLESKKIKTPIKKFYIFEGTITPKKDTDLKVFGANVSKISYKTGPERYYIARVKADYQTLYKAVSEQMLNEYEPLVPMSDPNILAVFPTSRPFEAAPLGQEGTVIFIRKTETEGVYDFGCQAFFPKTIK